MQASVSIKRILFNNVAGFLLSTDNALVMVDTGHKGMNSRILRALEELGRSPEDLQLIILTHCHYDHAGGAAALKKITGAKLAVHELEAENLRKGRTTIPDGTRWKGKLIACLGRSFVKRVQKIEALEPDIIVGERMDLSEYGIPGYIMHTPGHTEGSQSIILENGTAIVGDNFLGFPGKEHYPPFADLKNAVLESWRKLIDTGAKELLPAHGITIDIEEIIQELPSAIRKYGSEN